MQEQEQTPGAAEPEKPESKPRAGIRPRPLPLTVGLGLGRDVVAEISMPRPMVRLPFGWVPGMRL